MAALLPTPTPDRIGRMRAPPLRTLAGFAMAAGALLVLAVAASLLATTHTLDGAVEDLVRHGRGEIYLERVESALLRHQRLTNQIERGATQDLLERRRALAPVFEDALRGAEEHAVEQPPISQLRHDVEAYLRDVESPDGRGRTPAAQEASRAALTRALEELDRIQAQYPHAVLEPAEQHAAEVTRVASVAGGIGIALVLLAVLVSALAFGRFLVAPLTRAERAIAAFRATGEPTHVPEAGPAEIREIARTLNQTTLALAEQRKRQLAFVGGVAHDLRSPISGVKMALAVLRQSQPQLSSDARMARALDVIERQTEFLSQMSTDLLDASRIEAGELRLSMADLDLCEVVREVADVHGRDSSRHRVELHLPASAVNVHGDPLRLQQVMGNLVSNAIKYSPDGGIVTVSVEATDGEGLIAVRDEGIGLAPEEISRIFEPFQRGKAASMVAPGAGLGLSILARIVAGHGGRVAVESAPGRGSTFRVWLPRAVRQEPSGPAP